MGTISRDTTIETIVEQHPQLIRPLRDLGIVCIRCGEPIWGTLEEVALDKGLVDVDAIVNQLNQTLDEAKS